MLIDGVIKEREELKIENEMLKLTIEKMKPENQIYTFTSGGEINEWKFVATGEVTEENEDIFISTPLGGGIEGLYHLGNKHSSCFAKYEGKTIEIVIREVK